MKVLVTGAAGFIGAHTCLRLLRDGHQVLGLDNFNSYYDPALKHARVQWVRDQAGEFDLRCMDLCDREGMAGLFAQERPQVVVHLAAQAGVRYSLRNPQAYIDSNLNGFLNVLEGCRHHPVHHLLYASSSSVYGASLRLPYRVEDSVDHPLSLYAATKKANEAMAHCYSHLFGIPSSGLRFFTVYGPWGRPDMSPMQFAQSITEGKPVQLFNHGQHRRDFTYIDDIIEGLVRLIPRAPTANADWRADAPDPGTSSAPWRLLNIGGQQPVALLDYLALLERHLQRKAVIELHPMQPGDVLATSADTSALAQLTGFVPQVSLDEGLGRFVEWFRAHYPSWTGQPHPQDQQPQQRRVL